ncbi:hypothetical protein ATO49_07555 [Mycolicibacterium fortuitum subsp. fortuitum DSM 46621 = ATCC 6841 = JCM 6387]|nr:hypothetical protein ATO49_07555 [Mycolicibacterium fortuitum subsp. fortuitum DSM 46621 = ATCC 6841 = JCM 6387]
MPKLLAALHPSVTNASTANIAAAIQVVCTETPAGPCEPSTGTASNVNPASQANTTVAQNNPIPSARPSPSTTTAPTLTTTAAASNRPARPVAFQQRPPRRERDRHACHRDRQHRRFGMA